MDRPNRRLGQTLLLGLAGFLFPRFLEGLGVPLGEWAQELGAWVSITMSTEQATWVLSFVGTILGLVVGGYWPRIKMWIGKRSGAPDRTTPRTGEPAENAPAPPSPDMTIGQAVNYLLQETMWGYGSGKQWDAHPALDAAARAGVITVWGEQSIDTAEQLSDWEQGRGTDLHFSGVEVEIPREDWAHMEITSPTIMYSDHPSHRHPHMATPRDNQCVRCYRFMRVNRGQIEQQWAPRRR